MTEFLTVDDLLLFSPDMDGDRAEGMISDATALAMLAAPCLADEDTVLTDAQLAALKAVLRAAILRWDEAGSGGLQSQTIGGYSQTVDTRQSRRGMFWPSEIVHLQNICGGLSAGAAFSIDTTPESSLHLPWCSLYFGAVYCSCGVDIAGYPIFEDAP